MHWIRGIVYAWLIAAAGSLAVGNYLDGFKSQAITHLFMAVTLVGLFMTEQEATKQ